MLASPPRLVCARAGPLDVGANRWLDRAGDVDTHVLAHVRAPVLDVGCGPGRHVIALGERGVSALGIDITPGALEVARSRGSSVLRRSVFDRVPGAGRWATALLLDGNVGLAGEPRVLLRRVGSLLRPDGVVLAELAPPGAPDVTRRVRLEIDGVPGPWFALATVSIDRLTDVAWRAGLRVDHQWTVHGRWFATLLKIVT
jgi:SAM-dependent methyltransferase